MGVVSRRWMWVESMGVFVRRYRLLHITYPYSSYICSFCRASLLSVHLKNFFSFFIIWSTCICTLNYIVNKKFLQIKKRNIGIV